LGGLLDLVLLLLYVVSVNVVGSWDALVAWLEKWVVMDGQTSSR